MAGSPRRPPKTSYGFTEKRNGRLSQSHGQMKNAGVEAEVICDGATVEMRFPRAGSPRELIVAFAAVRDAFALSKAKPLSGLLG